MKLTVLSRSLAAALVAAASIAAVPANAQLLTIPIPASSVTGDNRADVGIDLTAIQTSLTNINNFDTGVTTGAIPIPQQGGANGSFATAPGAAVAVWIYVSSPYPGYYMWSNTTAVFDAPPTADDSSAQVPVGACVYGMGNNNPSWAISNIQCPSGSGWLTVGYETVDGPDPQTGGGASGGSGF